MREYRRRYEHLWYYWRAVKDAFVLSIQSMPLLRDGFWPISRIVSATENQFIEDGSICKEYDEDDYFVGQRWERPTPSF